jgi:hypothetical protein
LYRRFRPGIAALHRFTRAAFIAVTHGEALAMTNIRNHADDLTENGKVIAGAIADAEWLLVNRQHREATRCRSCELFPEVASS